MQGLETEAAAALVEGFEVATLVPYLEDLAELAHGASTRGGAASARCTGSRISSAGLPRGTHGQRRALRARCTARARVRAPGAFGGRRHPQRAVARAPASTEAVLRLDPELETWPRRP